MYALVSDQGTAMHETALCNTHYKDPDERNVALEMGEAAGDADPSLEFRNVSENDALSCLICGAGNLEELPEK